VVPCRIGSLRGHSTSSAWRAEGAALTEAQVEPYVAQQLYRLVMQLPYEAREFLRHSTSCGDKSSICKCRTKDLANAHRVDNLRLCLGLIEVDMAVEE
jgi:hypothetical protein